MIRRAYAIGALAAAVAWTSPAFAGHMTIKQTAKPLEYAYRGVSLDILGLKLGMTLDQVKKTIAGYSKRKPTIQTTDMWMTYKTVTVHSQKFTSKLEINKDDHNSITVYFGSPATGNRVVQIDRTMYFPDPMTAPTVKALDFTFYRKYGPVTNTSKLPARLHRLWDFGRLKLRNKCPTANCYYGNAAGHGYNVFGKQIYDPHQNSPHSPGRLYRKSYALGSYVYIEANITETRNVTAMGYGEPRVRKVLLSLSDEADQAITYDEALKQLQAAAVEAYKKERAEATRSSSLPLTLRDRPA